VEVQKREGEICSEIIDLLEEPLIVVVFVSSAVIYYRLLNENNID